MKASWFSGAEYHRKVCREVNTRQLCTYVSFPIIHFAPGNRFPRLASFKFCRIFCDKNSTYIKCRTLIYERRRMHVRISSRFFKNWSAVRATCFLSVIKTNDNNARIIGLSLEQDVHCYPFFFFNWDINGTRTALIHFAFFFNAKGNSTAHLTTCACNSEKGKEREKKNNLFWPRVHRGFS